MAPIPNQGFRRDLDLLETPNDIVALDNLMGVGIGEDLRFIQNNLRNTSSIPFNNVDANGFFSFQEDRSLQIESLSSVQVGQQNETRIIVNLVHPYDLKPQNTVELEGITDSGVTVFNGQYAVTSVSVDSKTIRLTYPNNVIVKNNISISGVSFKHKADNIFTFTQDDVINVSLAATFTVGTSSTTFSENTDYFVTESNGINKFKLSKTPSGSIVGLTTITVAGLATALTPIGSDYFKFVRKDPVNNAQLINFIKPEIQDSSGDFAYLAGDDAGTINQTIDTTQSNIEAAEYFTLKKYRGDRTLIETNESIKYEGSVVLNDPDNYIENSGTGSALAPGVYIGNTRAFSSDNNPWDKVGIALTTSSDQVSIGKLSFLDGSAVSGGDTPGSMVIGLDNGTEGIGTDLETLPSNVDASSFTHKIPIEVEDENGNSESYYLLVTET